MNWKHVWHSSSLFVILSIILLRPGLSQTPLPETPIIRPVVNRDYLPTVLSLIGEAKETIHFIQLEFHYDPTVKKIQDALREAVGRGVKVRGILEDDVSFNPTSNTYLNRFGIESKLDTERKATHVKLFIFDGEKVLLGSTNLSGNSIDNNNETNLYVADRRIGEYFELYFEQLWDDSFTEPELEPVEIPGLKTVVNRQHYDDLASMLGDARKRIWVVMYGVKYYDPLRYPDSRTNRLIDSLIEAKKRGVDVRVVLDKSDYNATLNQVNEEAKNYLEKGGVAVRYDDEKVTTHAKLVIADGKALVGSANWGYLAMDVRNEGSLLVSQPEAVGFFEDYFLQIWGE